jgi:hypothetical protein
MGQKLSGTHQLLGYADNVNLMEHDINNINEKTKALVYASKEVGLEVNTEKVSKS